MFGMLLTHNRTTIDILCHTSNIVKRTIYIPHNCRELVLIIYSTYWLCEMGDRGDIERCLWPMGFEQVVE